MAAEELQLVQTMRVPVKTQLRALAKTSDLKLRTLESRWYRGLRDAALVRIPSPKYQAIEGERERIRMWIPLWFAKGRGVWV